MPTARNEMKYQYIKLMKSGRSLRETKALTKSVETAFGKEYANQGNLSNLAKIEGGLHSLTRRKAVNLMTFKFKERKAGSLTREEHLARWVTGIRPQISRTDWKRDGNLIRRGPPNKPRPGSSRGKIGRTRIIGSKKVLNSLENLIRTLADLQKRHGRRNHAAIRKGFNVKRSIYKEARLSVKLD